MRRGDAPRSLSAWLGQWHC